jgi:caffeoyl-CoA O-methyltransferase
MVTYDSALSDYITSLFAPEDEVLHKIRQRAAQQGLPGINIRPEEGRLLQFLATALRARLALEIGTLGGYSGTWIARGLAPGGLLITVEKDPQRAQVARQNFALAGLQNMVEVVQGDALSLLPQLAQRGPFDLIFIDAVKEQYPYYLDWALQNGRAVAAHNAFRGGRILDRQDHDPSVEAIRQFNAALAQAEGWVATIFPAGDGMAVAVRQDH